MVGIILLLCMSNPDVKITIVIVLVMSIILLVHVYIHCTSVYILSLYEPNFHPVFFHLIIVYSQQEMAQS